MAPADCKIQDICNSHVYFIFLPAFLKFGRLSLDRGVYVRVCVCQCVCVSLQLLLFLPLLPAMDFPQLLQGIVGYRKGTSSEEEVGSEGWLLWVTIDDDNNGSSGSGSNDNDSSNSGNMY